MRRISRQEEDKLLSSVDKAISLVSTGVNPEEALCKVASENQYNPDFIKRLTTGFNRKRSVEFMKVASADKRSDKFPLADPDKVISMVYGNEKTASANSSDFIIPEKDYSMCILNFDTTMQKVAVENKASICREPDFKKMTRSSLYSLVQKTAALRNLMEEKYRRATVSTYSKIEDTLEKIADHVARMRKPEIQKMAQLVLNGYSDNGPKMLNLIGNKASVEIPSLQKQANAAVFPLAEPFVSINELHNLAEKYAVDVNSFTAFQKESFISQIMDVADRVSGKAMDLNKKITEDSKDIYDELDPQFFNKLKEIEAKKNFMSLALYDKDLQSFDYPTLLEAYNSAVSSVPESYSNPSVLKVLMLSRINSGGQLDPFQIKQEQELAGTLRSRDKDSAENLKRDTEIEKNRMDIKHKAWQMSTPQKDNRGPAQDKKPAPKFSRPAKPAPPPATANKGKGKGKGP